MDGQKYQDEEKKKQKNKQTKKTKTDRISLHEKSGLFRLLTWYVYESQVWTTGRTVFVKTWWLLS